MASCPSCGHDNPERAERCARCSTPLGVAQRATIADPNAPPAPADPAETFAPGTLLLGRYRIVALLGRGGMGSVYRAEDRVLEQEVALKFLAPRFANDPKAVAAFVNEVRLARRVSHPDVCRVHDVGEVEGRTFLSMEFIDGEDLATLLRRIGRMAGERAVQVARQICAGLAAAHEQGVLHRDLKPANILIDRDGNARIADFGIAGAADLALDGDGAAGTPAYMAPELFTGAPASIASDVYSLGAVLYELFTGRPLFDAESMTELLRRHRAPVPPPSRIARDLDPRVERLVLRCLERAASERPQSALAVLAELPGGDPLREALAAGRTPSPELVAAAGGSGHVPRRHALLLLLSIVLGLAAVLRLEPEVKWIARAGLDKEPAVLVDRARELTQRLGLGPTEPRASFETWGFLRDDAFVASLDAGTPRRGDWDRELGSGTALAFWYRSADTTGALAAHNVKRRVTWSDPPVVEPGAVRLRFDARGRLRELLAVPRDAGRLATGTAASDGAPDWSPLLGAAGFEPGALADATPKLVPLAFADQRVAWTQGSARIEAAAWRGVPVAFAVTTAPIAADAQPRSGWRQLGRGAIVLGALLLAWDAVRRRRADLRGALRIAAAVFAAVIGFTLLLGDHLRTLDGLGALLLTGMAHGLAVAAEVALYYVAVEHHVRRTWPESMIAWSRLLAGRGRDPMVGRSLLLGQIYGIAAALACFLLYFVPRWRGECEPAPLMLHRSTLETLLGPAQALGASLELGIDSGREAMKVFTSLVLLHLLLRNRNATAVCGIVLWASVWNYSGTIAEWLIAALLAAAHTVVAIRHGLLAMTVQSVTFVALGSVPLVLDRWHLAPAALWLGALASASAFGAWVGTRGGAR